MYLSADSQRGLITPEGLEKHYRSTGSEARKHLAKGEALGSRRTGDLPKADTSHDLDNGFAALGLSFPTCTRKGSRNSLTLPPSWSVQTYSTVKCFESRFWFCDFDGVMVGRSQVAKKEG